MGGLLQFHGFELEASPTLLEFAKLSAEGSKQSREAEYCAHRADRDECRLPPPIREGGSLGDRHIDNERIVRQRMHRFDMSGAVISLKSINPAAFGQLMPR